MSCSKQEYLKSNWWTTRKRHFSLVTAAQMVSLKPSIMVNQFLASLRCLSRNLWRTSLLFWALLSIWTRKLLLPQDLRSKSKTSHTLRAKKTKQLTGRDAWSSTRNQAELTCNITPSTSPSSVHITCSHQLTIIASGLRMILISSWW